MGEGNLFLSRKWNKVFGCAFRVSLECEGCRNFKNICSDDISGLFFFLEFSLERSQL